MSTQQSKGIEGKITTAVMQKNWSLLKQIHVNDIIDSMIEQSLITVDTSRGITKKETESQQITDLLYLVFHKSQAYLDAFFRILNDNGYAFIVHQLLEDQDNENTKFPAIADGRPKTTGQHLHKTDHGQFRTQRREQTDVTLSNKEHVLRQKFMEEIKAEMKQQQRENINQQSELLKQQMVEIKDHNANIIQAEFAKLAESNGMQKELESRVDKLELQLKTLQAKLELEKSKARRDAKNSNDKIQELQRRKEELKLELLRVKKEFNETLKKVKQENLYMRNLVKQEKRSQSNVKMLTSKNPFTTPLNPGLAQTLEDVRNMRR